MTILIDSREKFPLKFDHPYVEKVEHLALPIGDYSCAFRDGYRPLVFFERKALGDLFNSMTGDYKRFKKEMQKAQEFGAQLIIITEGTLSKILKGYHHSTVEGISIVFKLFTLKWKHGIDHRFCKNRKEMALYIIHTYIAIGKQYLKALKKTQL